MREWIKFVWFSTRTYGGLLSTRHLTAWNHTRQKIV